MTIQETDKLTPRRPLRLWPGVVLALLLLTAKFVLPAVRPEASMFAIVGGLFAALAIVVWWLFFSRAPWSERLGAIALMVGALVATSRLVHESIANGMMGMMLPITAIPVLSVALVAATVASGRLSTGLRRASIAVAILLGCGAFTLLRTGGINGEGYSDLHWRWTPSPEERLLAEGGNINSANGGRVALPSAVTATEPIKESVVGTQPRHDEPAAHASTPLVVKKGADWPGFRGSDRDGVVRGVRIQTDWSKSPPVQLWRRPIGPGWSSFAVSGDRIYTQEQRGDDEVVSSYDVATGEPVWRHSDAVRFWESNGGAGPRATPTLSNGRVYTFGATGILNALDAGNGSVLWSHNAASDTGTDVPGWGFSSSPIVVDGVVVVAATGTLVAYDAVTGNRRWSGPTHGGSYSSPHRAMIDGVLQILLQSGAGVTSVEPSTGAVLWEHDWPGLTIVQPALTADGDVVISTASAAGGVGMRRIAVKHGPGGWSVEERWTSSGLKPYFNDFVIHKGHAFGFDGSILACLDLKDGQRKWKGGRYGHGQLVLLPDQDLLLVLSEEGELALVRATDDQYSEAARFPALEGKTWNHPVLVGDVLLVRNGEEMAAFRLSLSGR